jgi:hypothetical protein
VWADRTLAARLARRAFDGVRAHYTVEQSAGRLVEIYRSVVDESSRGGHAAAAHVS